MTLDELARTPRLLVALDFDGTLAPLVDEPMTARMTEATAAAVAALAAAPGTTVAFVSGRSLADLRVIAEHDDASSIPLAGSHGAQWWLPGHIGVSGHFGVPGDDVEPPAAAHSEDHSEDLALRDDLRAQAERLVSGIPGAWIEPKAFGFGVHSRLVSAADADEVHDRVGALMSQRAPHWRRRAGHAISEYAFRTEGKDGAVARLRELTDATAVLFAGDDVTDEDALRSLGAGDLGIRVGEGPTAATMRVADIDELAALLSGLAHQRSAARE